MEKESRMKRFSWRLMCALVVGGAGLAEVREAAAQGYLNSVPSLAPTPGLQTFQNAMAGSTPAVPPTTVDPTGLSGGLASPGSIFNNPLAAPLLYNSMIASQYPQSQATSAASASAASNAATANMAATQLGMMMLLANSQNGGFGSGRMSGTRSDPRQPTSLGAPSTSKPRGANQPGGKAARYFNRSSVRTSYPRNYFNRRPTYFP
jgi:hypothetical protein